MPATRNVHSFLLRAFLCLAASTPAVYVLAQHPPSATSNAESLPLSVPLPTIPPPQSTLLPAPEPPTVAELDELVSKLVGPHEEARKTALTELAELDATSIPAIAVKLAALRKSADRDGMSKIVASLPIKRPHAAGDKEDVQRDDKGPDAGTKERKKKEIHAAPEKADDVDNQQPTTPPGECHLIDPSGHDLLGLTLARPERDKPGYKDLITIVALERGCVCIGTTAAAREIINVFTYFGDLFRFDVQRQLARMGERAIPALIEAKYHDSRMVRTWAERRLDQLGKVIPSEAVRTHDNQVLADILRAYGRAREVEAVRVIVTYANSDRLQVREAAREAIGQIGEPARWQLRDTYENLTGHKAETGWDWKRIAQELFASYDRARLAEVYKMAEDGFARYKEGKLAEAIASFDKVLARAPLFERRAEMAPAYLDQARKVRDTDRSAALSALRRAEILDPHGPSTKPVQSEQALLEAEELSAHGLVDTVLLHRAIELDPSNSRAQAALERAERDAETRQASWRRYAAALAIAIVALAAMVFVALGRRKRGDDALPPARPEGGD